LVTAYPIKTPSALALGVFYAPIPPENRCHSGTKCPLARGVSRKPLPFGDKVPSGEGVLPGTVAIRGQSDTECTICNMRVKIWQIVGKNIIFVFAEFVSFKTQVI